MVGSPLMFLIGVPNLKEIDPWKGYFLWFKIFLKWCKEENVKKIGWLSDIQKAWLLEIREREGWLCQHDVKSILEVSKSLGLYLDTAYNLLCGGTTQCGGIVNNSSACFVGNVFSGIWSSQKISSHKNVCVFVSSCYDVTTDTHMWFHHIAMWWHGIQL